MQDKVMQPEQYTERQLINFMEEHSRRENRKRGEEATENPMHELSLFLLDRHSYMLYNNSLFRYDGMKGYIECLPNQDFSVFIKQQIIQSPEFIKSYKDGAIKDLFTWMIANVVRNPDEKQIENHSQLISFRNGLYDPFSDRIIPHSNEYYTFNYIDFEYHPGTKAIPGIDNFNTYLNNVTGGNTQLYILLQEVTGVLLSNITRMKMAYTLIGAPNSGKSTYLNILQHLIGRKFVSNIPFHRLGNEFITYQLFGKKINICAEISGKALPDVDVFKKLTGDDVINANRKFKEPVSFKNTAHLVFAGNEFMNVNISGGHDSLLAYLNRIQFIPFLYSIPIDRQDKFIFEKLKGEAEGIIFWAMNGLRRLINNNFQFTYCEASEIEKLRYCKKLDPIGVFIGEKCNCNNNYGTYVRKERLYKYFKLFCEEMGLEKPMSTAQFYKSVQEYPGIKISRRNVDGSYTRVFTGIELRNDI